ncbi:Quinone oxidoreductase [Enhygromyxa salina]|uniref:enoyl-[acyl-carrier-protein] reductase n=1 Tax=Enhygromyxa salina TaxID=215803 RepID=A0A0C1ZK44_9BACT|nr:zinc-binding dehydrogenase [Enhygromyxa salina]KIG17839.1 Quinone oxidoreductase [Enhygromyxa salina]
MRALRCNPPGGSGPLLELVELPEPQPREGEVLIEVLAAPISPIDRLSLRGLYPLRPASGIPGAQGVGLVVEHGQGVREPEVGSVVLLPVRVGAWCERLVTPAETLVPLSAHRDPVRACTLRIEALTAAVLLADLEPGECFLHSPGAGSVGRYLTVLARDRGLRSVALVGTREPIAELWGLGADNVLVREPGVQARLSALGLGLPRVAFDGSGGETSGLLGSCLRLGGELIVYGAASRKPVQLPVDQLVFKDIRVRGFWLHRWAETAGYARMRSELEALAAMDLHEQVAARFSLDQWPAALAMAEQPGLRGRVVFTPAKTS